MLIVASLSQSLKDTEVHIAELNACRWLKCVIISQLRIHINAHFVAHLMILVHLFECPLLNIRERESVLVHCTQFLQIELQVYIILRVSTVCQLDPVSGQLNGYKL